MNVNYNGEPIRFVTAYAVSRHYGGPEEGGWWYDRYETLESISVAAPADADPGDEVFDKAKAKLTARFGDIQQPGDRFSVLGNGDDLVILVEDEPGESQTTERPHYE